MESEEVEKPPPVPDKDSSYFEALEALKASRLRRRQPTETSISLPYETVYGSPKIESNTYPRNKATTRSLRSVIGRGRRNERKSALTKSLEDGHSVPRLPDELSYTTTEKTSEDETNNTEKRRSTNLRKNFSTILRRFNAQTISKRKNKDNNRAAYVEISVTPYEHPQQSPEVQSTPMQRRTSLSGLFERFTPMRRSSSDRGHFEKSARLNRGEDSGFSVSTDSQRSVQYLQNHPTAISADRLTVPSGNGTLTPKELKRRTYDGQIRFAPPNDVSSKDLTPKKENNKQFVESRNISTTASLTSSISSSSTIASYYQTERTFQKPAPKAQSQNSLSPRRPRSQSSPAPPSQNSPSPRRRLYPNKPSGPSKSSSTNKSYVPPTKPSVPIEPTVPLKLDFETDIPEDDDPIESDWDSFQQDPGAVIQLNKLGLSSLPQTFCHGLDHVRNIEISNNLFRQLPEELLTLAKLEVLDFSNNRLSSLPEDFGTRLYSLRQLNLANNQLKTLPKSIGLLKDLEALNVENNILHTLPWNVGMLQSLQRLLLSGNSLSSIPSSMANLENLVFFHLGEWPEDFSINRIDPEARAKAPAPANDARENIERRLFSGIHESITRRLGELESSDSQSRVVDDSVDSLQNDMVVRIGILKKIYEQVIGNLAQTEEPKISFESVESSDARKKLVSQF